MKGNLTITRISKSNFNMYFEDETSGTRFLEVEINGEQLMQALSGLGMVDCDFDLAAQYVGWKRETKQVAVKVPQGFNTHGASERQWKDLLARYEEFGWTAYRGDIGNHHKWVKGTTDTYAVTFTRFVPPVESPA
jgi:hypothetical protein